MSDDALLKELLECFELEAQDHIGALSGLLLSLERETDGAERSRLVESVFRRVHTLKGAAHAVNLAQVAHACQELETLLVDLKTGAVSLERDLFDRLHRDVDGLAAKVSARAFAEFGQGSPSSEAAAAAEPRPAAPVAPPITPAEPRPAAPVAAPAGTAETHPAAATDTEPAPHPARERGPRHGAEETVRVSTRLLESLLLQSEELVSAKLSASVLQEELAAVVAALATRTNERGRELELSRRALRSSQDPAAGALAQLLDQGVQRERGIESRLKLLEKGAERHLRGLQGMVDPLLQDMKKLHLLPFSSLADSFSKLVRDLARELDKEAELELSGGDLEIDRRILAQLKEPLLHLVRNMVDHGIEKQGERRALGKPEKGRIVVDLRLQDANRAELVITDDGCGIDIAQVKATALRLELVPEEVLERMPDHEALQLIFESGVTTSRIISSISGRGVGLAIVREGLEKLGGHVAVESVRGAGCTFRLFFPLSFAMMRGLLVQAGGRDCIIPAANVEQSGRAVASEVKRVENRDTIHLGNEVVALASLSRMLELNVADADPEAARTYVLLRAGERSLALSVDQVHGVQEVLVKPLGRQLERVRNVAGATVLGDGRVVPVLNLADLFRSAQLDQAQAQPAGQRPQTGTSRTVLVAEDSITSRTLLKNILEASGYSVRTAVDGMDALTQVRSEHFDVVVSDVEMPRMDGFQLTAALRADTRFEKLPVILVTGLESRADRERGIEVGASAYLVKSGFDQGSLIDVIQKLT